jgi:hypothetical protein
MFVRGRAVLVAFLAVFVRRHCMLFGFIVAAVLVMMGGLPVMVRRLLVVCRSRTMMLACRMFRFCHRSLPDIFAMPNGAQLVAWNRGGLNRKASRTGEIFRLLRRESVKLIHLQFRRFLY